MLLGVDLNYRLMGEILSILMFAHAYLMVTVFDFFLS